MIVALSLFLVLLAFVIISRGQDVRLVLLCTSLAIGLLAHDASTVFRTTANTLADGKFILPICSAMGFAHVVRETGCVDALVEMMLKPLARAHRAFLPGGSFVAFIVNAAIPSQTSTLAAVGPLVVAPMARLRSSAVDAGAALVYGGSIGGALMNPGVADIAAVATVTGLPAPRVVVPLAPACIVTFVCGMAAFLLARRLGIGRNDDSLAAPASESTVVHHWAKALLPPLPVVVLLLGHPSLPTAAMLERVVPKGLEVFTAMLAGSVLAIVFASKDRSRAVRSLFDGMGYAFTHVITFIAVSAGTAKALDVAGVFKGFVGLTSGHAGAAYAIAFILAFGLAVVSGSGTASSVALVTAIAPRAAELGVSPIALSGVILFGAEAGRTTSPVAAVVLFGGTIVAVPPRKLAFRLAIPSLVGGLAGAAYSATLLQ
jgi:DcuC family C4-dicarboxylate transporter